MELQKDLKRHLLEVLKEDSLTEAIFLQKKDTKRKRHLRDDVVISSADKAAINRMLPY